MTTQAKRKKAVKPKASHSTKRVIVLETKMVPLEDLQMYHKNPRIGNPELVGKSLHMNGQFKPIVVNVGSKTGRKNEILAGNHTYLGARKEIHWVGRDGIQYDKEPWDTIYAAFVDVTEEQAARIVLEDNKTGDNSSYDEGILAEIFANLPDIEIASYEETEIDAILAEAGLAAEEAVRSVERGLEEEEERELEDKRSKSFSGVPLGEEDSAEYDDDEIDTSSGRSNTPEDAEEELAGLVDLKDELPDEANFRVGYWGIPKLRKDMIPDLSEIPSNLEAWAGSATKGNDDPNQWWLYNWGIDSTSGMRDVSKVIISFYTWDDYFDNWFWETKKYVVKLLNSKIKFGLTPNYSMWPEQSQTLNLWALYRARYVGRYMQEAGIKVIPDINWPMGDIDFLRDHVLATLPKNIPMIALQLQTFEKDAVEQAGGIKPWQLVVDTLKPKAILLYAGKPGAEYIKKNLKFSGEIKVIETRQKKLSEALAGRTRKKGI